MNNQLSTRLPFLDFVRMLQNEGFVGGLAPYLRIEQLLGQYDGAIDPSCLRTTLCPLFATNADEQRRFYELFDRYYGASENHISRLESPTIESSRQTTSRALLLALIIGALVVACAIWFLLTPKASTAPSSSTVLKDDQAGKEIRSQPAPTRPQSTQLPLPTPRRVDGDSTQPVRHSIPLLRWLWMLPGVIGFLYLLWYCTMRRAGAYLRRHGYGRQRFSLLTDLAVKLPILAAPTKLCDIPRPDHNTLDFSMELDLPRTVYETATHGGFPQLHFLPVTRQSEYVVLIDRMSERDHYARLIDYMVRHLSDSGRILIDKYYFTSDPRVCVRAKDGISMYLVDVLAHHLSSRLLIFGDCSSLWNSFTGRWASWANILLQRPKTAVLTPRVDCWGTLESMLKERVVLRSATVEGLSQALRCLQDGSLTGSPLRGDGSCTLPTYPTLETPKAMRSYLRDLRSYIGDESLRLLAACALYPRLEWDLTLHFAQALRTLLSDGIAFLRIVSLPWFRMGHFPLRLQQELFDSLDPAERRRFHDRILGFLQRSADSTRVSSLEITVQKFGLSPKERRTLQSHEALTELAIVAGRSRIALYIPERLRRTLFRFGVPGLGFKLSTLLTCALITVASVGGFFFFSHLSYPQSTSTNAVTQLLEESYQLSTGFSQRERLYYLTRLARISVDYAPAQKVEQWCMDLFTLAHHQPVGWDRVATEKNALVPLSRINPNKAMQLLPQVEEPQPTINGTFPEDLRAVAAEDIFQNYWRAVGPHGLSAIESEARHIGVTGEYPYHAMAQVILELTKTQNTDHTEADHIFTDALKFYRGQSSKFLDRDEEFLSLLRSVGSSISSALLLEALHVFVDRITAPTAEREAETLRIQILAPGGVFEFNDRSKADLFVIFPMIRENDPVWAARLARQDPELLKAREIMSISYTFATPGHPTPEQLLLVRTDMLEKSILTKVKELQGTDPKAALALAQRLTDPNVRLSGLSAIVPGMMKTDPAKAKSIYAQQLKELSLVKNVPQRLSALVAVAQAAHYVGDDSSCIQLSAEALDIGTKLFETNRSQIPDQSVTRLSGFQDLAQLGRFGGGHDLRWMVERVRQVQDIELKAYLLMYVAEGMADGPRNSGL